MGVRRKSLQQAIAWKEFSQEAKDELIKSILQRVGF